MEIHFSGDFSAEDNNETFTFFSAARFVIVRPSFLLVFLVRMMLISDIRTFTGWNNIFQISMLNEKMHSNFPILVV